MHAYDLLNWLKGRIAPIPYQVDFASLYLVGNIEVDYYLGISTEFKYTGFDGAVLTGFGGGVLLQAVRTTAIIVTNKIFILFSQIL